MTSPVVLPTHIPDGQGPGCAYRVEGELVPALHFRLDGSTPVLHEHHVLLWKQPQINIEIAKLGGVGKSFKRALAGLPVLFTQATGAGELAMSRDQPGQIVALALPAGQSIYSREHSFLAALSVEYGFEKAGGFASMMLGSQGIFMDRFTGSGGTGLVFLHAHGNAQEVVLGPGEVIDVEPGAWLYRDASVGYTQQVFGLKTGILSGGVNLIWNRFTGPGRVGLQTGYFMDAPVVAATRSNPGSAAGALFNAFTN